LKFLNHNSGISNGGEWKINNLHTRYRCHTGNFKLHQKEFSAHLKFTWQFEKIRISLRWMVLREFQDGGRIKLEPWAKRWYIKERSIDWLLTPLKSRWTVPLSTVEIHNMGLFARDNSYKADGSMALHTWLHFRDFTITATFPI
jgi:hypothetical protein